MPTDQEVKEAIKVKLVSGELDQAGAEKIWANYKSTQTAPAQTIAQPQATTQTAQAAQQPQLEDLTAGQRLLGSLEAGGFLLGQAIIQPVAGLTGLAVGGATQDSNKAAGAVKQVQELIPTEPVSDYGKRVLGEIGGLVQDITDFVNIGTGGMAGVAELVAGSEDGNITADTLRQARDTFKNVQEKGLGKTVADRVFEETGNPAAATAALITPDAIIETIGLKGIQSFKRSPLDVPLDPKKAIISAAPAAKDIKKRATGLYDELDALDVGIDQESYLSFAINLKDKALNMGLDPKSDLTDKANHVLTRIESEFGSSMNLNDMERLRKVASVAAGDINNKTNAAIGTMIIDEIDRFTDAQAGRFASKGGPDAAAKFKEARDLWSRYRKAEVLDQTFNRADLAASGLENGLRNEFRSILKNPKKLRGFTPEEKDAMRVIVKGTTAENFFSKLSNLGISPDQRRNFLGSYLGIAGGAGVGTAVGGPLGGAIGGVAVPALGTFSASMAQKMIKNNNKFANALVRAGKDGTKVAREYFKAVPVRERNLKDLTELLLNTDADVSKFGDAGMRKLIKDASFIAGELRKAGQTSFFVAPLIPEEENGLATD